MYNNSTHISPDWPNRVRCSKYNPCPVCGRTKPNCRVDGTRHYFICENKNYYSTPLGWREIKLTRSGKRQFFIENLADSFNPTERATARLNSRPSPNSSSILLPIVNIKPTPLPAGLVDEMFRFILDHFPLNSKHRNYLLSQGVDPTYCRSFIRKGNSKIAEALVEKYGPDIAARFPGVKLVRKPEKRPYWGLTAYAQTGILYPAIDELTGRIAGVQVRNDEPGEKRYMWMSHSSLGGTPITFFKALDERYAHILLITEGFKKISAALQHYLCNTLSIAGVDGWKVEAIGEKIKVLGIKELWIALDADKHKNKDVKRAEARLIKELKAFCDSLKIQIKIYTLEWDLELGGKGLDDALLAGAEPTFEVAEINPDRQKSFMDELPPAIFHALYGGRPQRKLYTKEEAREYHYHLAIQTILSETPERIVLTSAPGTGKSYAVDSAVKDYIFKQLELGIPPIMWKRILITAPNKANIKERLRPGQPLHDLWVRGQKEVKNLIAIQQGREYHYGIDPLDPATYPPLKQRSNFDCWNPQAKEALDQRHAPALATCAGCPFSSDEKWLERFPDAGPRPFKCEKDGYSASRKISDAATVVIATPQSFLNNSKKIEGFDVIFVDERLTPYLTDTFDVRLDHLVGWRRAISDNHLAGNVDPIFTEFFSVIEKVLSEAPSHFKQPDSLKNRLYPALPPLQTAATQFGPELKVLLYKLSMTPPERNDTYSFERSYPDPDNRETKITPLRAMAELVKALSGEGVVSLARSEKDGAFCLQVRMVNAQLVKTLREKTLVVTDATAPLGLRKLFPGIKEVKFDVPENLKIAQATHAFLAARDLLNEKTVASLEACIEAFTGKEDKALALMPKAIYEDGALKLPENVTGGYWGRDERATNAFSGCNILFLLSHYLGPIDQIKAGLNAIKAFLREPLISEEEENDGWVWRFKPILHAPGQGGYTIGRWSRASADPELQEAIDQDHASHIIQAIGRLRAALRAAGDPPALVVIFSNDPVDGLPIDHVFKAKNGRELVGELGQYKADFEAEYQKMPLLVATPPSKADSFLNIVMKLPENGRGIERKVAFFDSGMRFILTRSCPKENLDPWLKVEAIYHLPPRSAPPLFQAAGATD